ncbi:hypothetical protein ACFY1S_26250 [Micromonospora sp. NPDC000663]|uniref:hypothetical protein n=1 Tax=Micromonospora sp. NPDC000663 TaxID=3364218 RepID=UPI0036AF02F1
MVNNAAFVMSFSVAASNGLETSNTDTYPINQSRTIDLTTTALPVGADVRPVVDAVAERRARRAASCRTARTGRARRTR